MLNITMDYHIYSRHYMKFQYHLILFSLFFNLFKPFQPDQEVLKMFYLVVDLCQWLFAFVSRIFLSLVCLQRTFVFS